MSMSADTFIKVWLDERELRKDTDFYWQPHIDEFLAAIKVLPFAEGRKIITLYEHVQSDPIGRAFSEQVDNFQGIWPQYVKDWT